MKERFIINNAKYTMQDLQAVWKFFKEKGYPTDAGCFSKYSEDCTIDYSCFRYRKALRDFKEYLEYTAVPELQPLTKAYDNLDVFLLLKLSVHYVTLWKQAEAKLALKGRKPLTEKEFKADAYEKYLKDFEEETKRLKKEAGEE